ncbi:hypothetical protein ACP275_08G229600 [Erythranthe tilingii]
MAPPADAAVGGGAFCRCRRGGPTNDTVQEEQVQGIHSQLQIEVNVNTIEADPELRLPISVLAKTSKELETIRRAYLQKGPCQPRLHTFPQSTLYGQERRFNADWYNEFGSWLEYSESKDEVFCLCCYLFKVGDSTKGGGYKFVGEGYKNWHKKKSLRTHEGNHDSVHHHCYMVCQDLMNNKCHIDVPLANKTKESKREYYIRLRTTTKAIRYPLRQGLALWGHDESNESLNKDNDEINRVVLDNSPGNCIMKAPDIQNQIISSFAHFASKAIICDIGDDFFALLVDEARDVSIKEQMAVDLRYVNGEGKIIERFTGVVHVPNTTARCLKVSLESLLTAFGLSLSRSAFYVHCFAHQLQLALVQITKKNKQLSNIIGGFCKRQELLREKQFEKLGLNQKATLKRSGDTRWNSYYFTILKYLANNGDDVAHCGQATILLRNIEFLGITNDLSQALQKKDQDLANAMKLVTFAKDRLQELKEDGWGKLLQETSDFCVEHDILIEVLYTVIDLQLSELNGRFDNTNTELLSLISCFDPSNSFSAFDINALVKLAGFYPNEFDDCGLIVLENFIRDVRSDQDFSNMVGASRLAEKLVAKRKNITYPSVYLLLKLSLILSVAIASGEMVFSAMKIVKSELRNRMWDQLLNDILVSYIEKDILDNVSVDEVMIFFQEMGPRRKIF